MPIPVSLTSIDIKSPPSRKILFTPTVIFPFSVNLQALEIKFKTYLKSASEFAEIFEKVFDTLQITFDKNTIVSSHNNFLKGQEEILQNHKSKNDIFAEGNLLGEKYYQQYGLNFNESNFDKIYKA